ncbi:polysaccharide biosynthesis/export family protein [Roseicitreum antarcticum]|uniref:Polysaccharide export outer membrane protein n=1 Tax=Roseicitreum antarcticum TaxID=564137 RepID=A0A1H3CQN5_9RHOB|nr:polysaccharide biosynthesis/export family protein [Roseicitreum antarcticum]SDX56552.1 polysaccharide export outer membrane protein [Roseicitreum antarcticum]
MVQYSRRYVIMSGSAAVMLGGCALPRNAPQKREVLAGLDSDAPGFSLHVVTRATLPQFASWPATGPTPAMAHVGWPGPGRGPHSPTIAPGDRLNLRIWDADETSLITAPDAQVTDMPGLSVSPSGHIFLPYVDEVHVAGLTPDGARRQVQSSMAAITPSAQVQLEFAAGQANAVDMVSGVVSPGNYPFAFGSMSILNVISAAGGVPDALRNPQVRLMRSGRVHGISLAAIYDDPAKDVALQGRDRVIIEADDRAFTALGATGRQEVLDFDTDRISALSAVSMMGGITDTRADPRGILILRRYPAAVVGQPRMPTTERVVFSLDLTTADGLFSADEFAIQSGDVVLATQSPVTSVERVFQLLGSAFGLAARARG